MQYYCHNPSAERLIYTGFVRDLREMDGIPSIKYPSEYDGQQMIIFCCTQHTDMDWETCTDQMTDARQRKITAEWVDFLMANQLPLREVQLCTLTPQRIFNALCTQSGVESLRIKWLRCNDISAIAGMKHLKKLFIERAPSLIDISPLASRNHEAARLLPHRRNQIAANTRHMPVSDLLRQPENENAVRRISRRTACFALSGFSGCGDRGSTIPFARIGQRNGFCTVSRGVILSPHKRVFRVE